MPFVASRSDLRFNYALACPMASRLLSVFTYLRPARSPRCAGRLSFAPLDQPHQLAFAAGQAHHPRARLPMAGTIVRINSRPGATLTEKN
jgi:hypothetical protein